MLRKKKILIGLLTIAIIATTIVSVQAVPAILKIKNSFQLVAETGDVEDIKQNEDFRYTEIDESQIETEQYQPNLSTNNEGEGESESTFIPPNGNISEGPKINIYNKMLNAVDFYNNLQLVLETSMLDDSITAVEFQIDINGGTSYQKVERENSVVSETYSSGDNMIRVNNDEQTYLQNYLPTYSRSDSPYLSLSQRITTLDDGVPCYVYRKNITNCSYANYSVFPQGIAFSFLKDFDKWEIKESDYEFLDRNCVVIEGTTSPYIVEKHNIDHFTMIVDSNTGVLLDLHGTLNNSMSQFITVKECVFEGRTAVKQFEESSYASYTERYRDFTVVN